MNYARRSFVRNALGAGIGLAAAPSLLIRLSQTPSSTSAPASDQYANVDPELVPALKQLPAWTFSAELLPAARRLPPLPGLPVPVPQPLERHIPGPHSY